MKRITIITAILLLVGLGNRSMAQGYTGSNDLLYHSFRSPQAVHFNPSFFPTYSMFYFTLPGVSMNINSPLAINDILSYTPGDTATRIDVNNILAKLKKNGDVNLGLEADLLGFGFTFGDNFITLGSRLIFGGTIGLPAEAFSLLTQGNIDANGDPITQVTLLDGDLFSQSAYLEHYLSFAHNFFDLGLTVGAKVKLLAGIESINTQNTRVELNTSNGMDNVNANIYYNLQAGAYLPIDTTNNSLIMPTDVMQYLPPVNGIAFDLGAQYTWKNFTFSASVLNLSQGLHWKDNIYAITPEDGTGSFSFSGFDIVQSGLLSGGNLNMDTLTNYFQQQLAGLKPTTAKGQDFYQPIPTKMNLGASYSLNNMIRVGALFHGEWAHGWFGPASKGGAMTRNFRSTTSLSADFNIANWLEFVVGNSFVNDGEKLDIFNPGAGLVITPLAIFQIYAVADYVSSIYLVEEKDLKIRLGLNLLFGNGILKRAERAVNSEVE